MEILIFKIDTVGKGQKQVYDELAAQYKRNKNTENFDTSIAGLTKVIYQSDFDERLNFFGNKFTVSNVSDFNFDDENCFVIELFENGDDLNLHVIYNCAKYKNETIELFANLYEKKLNELLDFVQ